eukprot:CAMPEP_0182418618 /NCGR_PEP_ID=MMETSP1167-20130531/2999_1 /TAXON_ID=2988 /ORGANISM="Mallomonas Sp, Strain CCMP3275" /LENGTH=241 /DNA_ID=CAMNT_0024592903 /DNA_START=4166 /DNA_END=4891 /DNA_ORIENTATION=-
MRLKAQDFLNFGDDSDDDNDNNNSFMDEQKEPTSPVGYQAGIVSSDTFSFDVKTDDENNIDKNMNPMKNNENEDKSYLLPTVVKWKDDVTRTHNLKSYDTVMDVFRVIDRDDDGVLMTQDLDLLAVWYITFVRGIGSITEDEIEETIDHFLHTLDSNNTDTVTFDSFYNWFVNNMDLENPTDIQKQMLFSFGENMLDLVVKREKKKRDSIDQFKADESIFVPQRSSVVFKPKKKKKKKATN